MNIQLNKSEWNRASEIIWEGLMAREDAGHERKIAWELLEIPYKREASVGSQLYKYSTTINNKTLLSSMTTADSFGRL